MRCKRADSEHWRMDWPISVCQRTSASWCWRKRRAALQTHTTHMNLNQIEKPLCNTFRNAAFCTSVFFFFFLPQHIVWLMADCRKMHMQMYAVRFSPSTAFSLLGLVCLVFLVIVFAPALLRQHQKKQLEFYYLFECVCVCVRIVRRNVNVRNTPNRAQTNNQTNDAAKK